MAAQAMRKRVRFAERPKLEKITPHGKVGASLVERTYFAKMFVSPNLDIQVPGLEAPFRVKVVGINHGQSLIAPLGIKTARLLRQELSKEKGLIFAEDKGRDCLPWEYGKKAKSLEEKSPVLPFVLRNLVQYMSPLAAIKMLVGMSFLGGKETIKRYLLEFFHKAERIEGFAPRVVLTPKLYKEQPETQKYLRKLGLTPEQFISGFRLITGTRSLLMASKIIEEVAQAGQNANSATVVLGAAHMSEVFRFLSSPSLALRYIDRAIDNLQKMKKTEKIIGDLANARERFSRLLVST